jgi:hypothetical protein
MKAEQWLFGERAKGRMGDTAWDGFLGFVLADPMTWLRRS